MIIRIMCIAFVNHICMIFILEFYENTSSNKSTRTRMVGRSKCYLLLVETHKTYSFWKCRIVGNIVYILPTNSQSSINILRGGYRFIRSRAFEANPFFVENETYKI